MRQHGYGGVGRRSLSDSDSVVVWCGGLGVVFFYIFISICFGMHE